MCWPGVKIRNLQECGHLEVSGILSWKCAFISIPQRINDLEGIQNAVFDTKNPQEFCLVKGRWIRGKINYSMTLLVRKKAMWIIASVQKLSEAKTGPLLGFCVWIFPNHASLSPGKFWLGCVWVVPAQYMVATAGPGGNELHSGWCCLARRDRVVSWLLLGQPKLCR